MYGICKNRSHTFFLSTRGTLAHNIHLIDELEYNIRPNFLKKYFNFSCRPSWRQKLKIYRGNLKGPKQPTVLTSKIKWTSRRNFAWPCWRISSQRAYSLPCPPPLPSPRNPNTSSLTPNSRSTEQQPIVLSSAAYCKLAAIFACHRNVYDFNNASKGKKAKLI